MSKILKVALVASAALGGAASMGGTASAMPMSGADSAVTRSADVQNVAFVCGPYRCFHRPGYVYRGFYGPRRFWGGGYGWRYRHWR